MDASDYGSLTALEEFDELELDSDFNNILAALDDENNIQIQFSEAVSEVSNCKLRKFALDNCRRPDTLRCTTKPVSDNVLESQTVSLYQICSS